MENDYVTIQFEIEPELYHAAQESLAQIGCTVAQYAVLCLLKGARYLRDIPDFSERPSHAIIEKIVSDVVEELTLFYLNRPDRPIENDVHK